MAANADLSCAEKLGQYVAFTIPALPFDYFDTAILNNMQK